MVQSDLQASAQNQFCKVSRWVYAGLGVILALYCVMSCVGITWGLPSRKIDPFLFGKGEVWSGEKIFRLAHAGEKFSAKQVSSIGADVDVNPFEHAPATPVLLTATEEDVAKIYLRYRLYTYQPDEMITMMALAGMRPGELQLDPRLYQYGGLFIYPVGALIKLCGMIGLIDVRSDIAFYLDNPDEFGKFYVVARAYSAAWGLVGVIVVFGLTRRFANAIRTPNTSEVPKVLRISDDEHRIQGGGAGLIAALLFTLMPVVVCMSHEGKPHLPGAVLMLLAVYLAILAVQGNRQSTIDNRKFFWFLCVCCGAAVGMVLSSWPICVLIPLVAMCRSRVAERRFLRIAGLSLTGGILAGAVYSATNPYVLINFFANRDILRSNFGNSLAMYQIARVGEGFRRVLELSVEGATLPVVVLGTIALITGIATSLRWTKPFWLLAVPTALFFAQFVFIGAGKPAEYGRFAIFSNTALVIGCACIFPVRWPRGKGGSIVYLFVFLWVLSAGSNYVVDFQKDAASVTSRIKAGELIEEKAKENLVIALPVEPAPCSCPPLNFSANQILLVDEMGLSKIAEPFLRAFIDPRRKRNGISWAGKRFCIRSDRPHTWFPRS